MKQSHAPLAPLQALRAIAALAVFLFHLIPYFEVAGANLFPKQFSHWGFAGVDVFFVLSGFVLALSVRSRDGFGCQASTRFYAHRLWRIYSGYWPFLMLMCLVNFFFGFERAADDNMLGSIFLTEIRLEKLVLGVSWTLTYELYFYALFSTIFLLPAAHFRTAACAYAASIIVFRALFPDGGWGLTISFILSPYILEFFLGAFLATHWLRKRRTIQPSVLWLAVIASFAAGAIILDVKPANELGRFLTFGIGSGALILALLNTTFFEKTMFGRALTQLGNASYTLYLGHLIFIDTAHELGFFVALGNQPSVLANLGAATFVGAVCLFSVVFYRLYERPTYLWVKKHV